MAHTLDKKAVTAVVKALVAAGANPENARKQLVGHGGVIDPERAWLEPLLSSKA